MMFGYKLTLPKALPQTKWATKTTVNDYSWINHSFPDNLEFSIVSSPVSFVDFPDQGIRKLSGSFIHVVAGDYPVRAYADPGVSVEISTVSVTIPGMKYEPKEFDGNDFRDTGSLLLPSIVDFLSEYELRSYEQRINRYIHSYMKSGITSELACAAMFFEFLTDMDTLARHQAGKEVDKYIDYYVVKTNFAIDTRFREKLTVNGLAAEFGITPNYLSSIYRSAMGVTFSHRLTEVRINHAKSLILSSGGNLTEIASQVGYGSESHLRKRFRDFMGISITEFICINNDQTLFHPKPVRDSETNL